MTPAARVAAPQLSKRKRRGWAGACGLWHRAGEGLWTPGAGAPLNRARAAAFLVDPPADRGHALGGACSAAGPGRWPCSGSAQANCMSLRRIRCTSVARGARSRTDLLVGAQVLRGLMRHQQRPFLIAAGGGGAAGSRSSPSNRPPEREVHRPRSSSGRSAPTPLWPIGDRSRPQRR